MPLCCTEAPASLRFGAGSAVPSDVDLSGQLLRSGGHLVKNSDNTEPFQAGFSSGDELDFKAALYSGDDSWMAAFPPV